MKRVLAASSIVALTLSIPGAAAVAHPCACFPPGEWSEANLPSDIVDLNLDAATVVGDSFWLFGHTEESGLSAVVLPMGGSGTTPTSGVIDVDLRLPEGGSVGFVAGDASSDDVLIGGTIRADDEPGSQSPWVQTSNDMGQTWTDLDVGGSGLDIVIDGTRHGEGFAVSGAIVNDGVFSPGFTTFDGEAFTPAQQLGEVEGYGITIGSGPGPDTLTVGGVTVNPKGKQRPALFTVHGGEMTQRNVPGAKDAWPTDIVASGTDVLVTTSKGQVMHAGEIGGKLAPIKSLAGAQVRPLTANPDTAVLAFDPSGLRFSFDGGDSWARTALDGIADAGYVKATGITLDGDFAAVSRGDDGLAHLWFALPPAGIAPVDGYGQFASMMAGFFIKDLVEGTNGVPTRQFVDEVTGAMHDTFSARAAGEVEETGEEGSAQWFASEFLDRLEAAGGSSGMTSEHLFRATHAIAVAYDQRSGASQ